MREHSLFLCMLVACFFAANVDAKNHKRAAKYASSTAEVFEGETADHGEALPSEEVQKAKIKAKEEQKKREIEIERKKREEEKNGTKIVNG